MKSSLFAAAAAIAVACAASSALADGYTPNGYVGADYSYDHVQLKGAGSANVNTYSVSGSTDIKFGETGNLQVDGNVTHSNVSHGLGDFTSGGVNAHLFSRTDQGAFGVTGGWRRDQDINTGNVGFEAARFVNKWTFTGVVDYAWTDSHPGFQSWAAEAEARYFVADNIRVDGFAGYNRLSTTGFGKDGWNVGVGGEYQLATTPVSLYGKVAYEDLEKIKATSVRVGVRWTFGGTLKSRDRSGSTFTTPTTASGIVSLF